MSHLRYVLLAVLVLCVSAVHGAGNLFRNINIKAGLCDNSVNCIRQDCSGMLWFATWNGLCRYDGLSFYTFRHELGNEGSIINNHINKIEIDSRGLWALTHQGLDYLSFGTGRFERCRVLAADGSSHVMSQNLMSMVFSGGRLIVTDTDGHIYINETEDRPELFRRVPLRHKIVSICNYRGGQLLGVGPGGVYLLSPGAGKVLATLRININSGSKTTAYYSRRAGLLFVGHGIGLSSEAFAIGRKGITRVDTKLPADIMDITDCGSGTAFATDGRGLVLRRGNELTDYLPQNSNVCGDAFYSVFNDKDGNLWAGSYRMGISMLPARKPWWNIVGVGNGQLTYNIVTAVVPHGDKIYVGLDGGGLNIIDRNSGRLVKALSTAAGNLPGNNVVSIVRDDKYLYMAVFTVGLVRMSLTDGSVKTFPMPPAAGYKTNEVWTLHDDGRGRLWIGGPDVCLFNKSTGRITTLPALRGKNCTAMAAHGRYLWLSFTHDGIYKLDTHTLRIVAHYSSSSDDKHRIPADDIKYVYVDRHGTLWFTSESSGFFALDEKTGALTSFGTADGLTTHNVASIAEDGEGNLWLGTLNGLFRLNPYTKMFVRIDEDTELPSSYTYASSVMYDGTLYMGSIGGLVSFRPDRLNVSRKGAGVSFIALTLINDGGRELPLFGSAPGEITLRHDQNFFTLSFASPDMYAPGRLRFSCRLDGLDEGWHELAGRREVSYTNVPPGHYRFYVRCTDSTGRWGTPSVLDITITPPWYATTLARMLWTLLIAALAVGGAWLYKHELSIKNKVRISQIEQDAERKLDEAKMNFYTNITHELRTPVFLITAQLEELLSAHRSILQVPSSYLQAMYRSAKKLNSLVSRVIDFRKLDSGLLRLNLEHCDVAGFCRNLVDDYEELCSQKHITFTLSCPDHAVMLDCDPEKLETILSNLVSNSFKYTNENGHVSLIVHDEPDRVVFAVKDNGIGIVEEMRDTIFERFFRTKRAEQHSGGDGLGLSFVKSLVELHGGTIGVESEVNVGSTFTFFIPKKHADGNTETEAPARDNAIVDSPSEPVDVMAESVTEQVACDEEPADNVDEVMPANPAAAHSVLVIDDERETVNLIERNLSSDYKVYKAYDGEQGLATARKMMPDIVICDIMMPHMNGLEFLEKIKSDKQLKGIKVIIFTAKTSDEDMQKAYESGADSYLTKPISLKVLRTRVDRLVAQTDDAMNLTGNADGSGRKYNNEEKAFLTRCREIIDDNLSNPDFSIELMTERLAMSHSALYKKVKAITGLSLVAFINDYKICVAVQMFRQGTTNVETVSQACGFRDIKSFRELFKRKMNMTPKQFVMSL